MIIILIKKGKFYYAGAPMEGEYTVSFSEPVVIKWKSKLNDVNVDYELHYKDGVMKENGKIREAINFKDGLRHGNSTYYDENGNVTKVEKYSNGVKENK